MEALTNIKAWRKSWFDTVETEDQYQDSVMGFKIYYNKVKDIIGPHYTSHIDDILRNVYRNIHHIGHHHFI